MPLSLAFCLQAMVATSTSPYAGQESRAIKALSADEVESLVKGKGMGFAMAAELNGYPGPKHVLELAEGLNLSDAQRQSTQALFDAMQARAKGLGEQLVVKERELDTAFAQRTITPESLAQQVTEIGQLRAEIRLVHLQAHLDQVAILNEEQVRRYSTLRGYGGHQGHGAHHGQH